MRFEIVTEGNARRIVLIHIRFDWFKFFWTNKFWQDKVRFVVNFNFFMLIQYTRFLLSAYKQLVCKQLNSIWKNIKQLQFRTNANISNSIKFKLCIKNQNTRKSFNNKRPHYDLGWLHKFLDVNCISLNSEKALIQNLSVSRIFSFYL